MKKFLILICYCFLIRIAFAQTPIHNAYGLKKIEGPIPDPNAFILLDKELSAINMEEMHSVIRYPEIPPGNELDGSLTIRVLVDTTGELLDSVIILNHAHPFLEEAVLSKIYLAKFAPAIQNGKKVTCWMTIPFCIHPKRQ